MSANRRFLVGSSLSTSAMLTHLTVLIRSAAQRVGRCNDRSAAAAVNNWDIVPLSGYCAPLGLLCPSRLIHQCITVICVIRAYH